MRCGGSHQSGRKKSHLVQLVVDLVEDEGTVIVGSVLLHRLVNCARGQNQMKSSNDE